MTLSETLTFTKVTLPKMGVKIHNNSPRVTLTLEAELTVDTAKVVGCHDSAFDAQDAPRGGFDEMDLLYEIDACQIKLHSLKENGLALLITPQAVDKFKVFRVSDSELGLRFAVTTDRARDSIDFLLENAGVEFEATVEPGQAQLDFSGPDTRAREPIEDADFLDQLGIGEEEPPKAEGE